MKVLNWITGVLLLVGGLNWGFVGFLDLNIVEKIFGDGFLATIIYDLVGLAALYFIIFYKKICKKGPCSASTPPMA